MTTYTNNPGAIHYLSFPRDGHAYSVTWDIDRTGSTAAVLDKPRNLLDASSEFTRVVFTAFLLDPTMDQAFTNPPVAFLFPRDPALHSYKWRPITNAAEPFLLRRATFTLDEEKLRTVPDKDVNYFYGSSNEGRSRFKAFQDTQRTPSEYSVLTWTNLDHMRLPLFATLKFRTLDAETGREIAKMHVLRVTEVGLPGSLNVMPPLGTNSYVQHVLKGSAYAYVATNGSFLSAEQAMAVGTAMRPAPR